MPNPSMPAISNFSVLRLIEPDLALLGMRAEKYFLDDPNTCLMKLRQFGEYLARILAARNGITIEARAEQSLVLKQLQSADLLPKEIRDMLHELRTSGNNAVHALEDDQRTALLNLRYSWQLGVWLFRTLKDAQYKSGPFIPPATPKDASVELQETIAELRKQVNEQDQQVEQANAKYLQEALLRQTAEELARQKDIDTKLALELAAGTEADNAALLSRINVLQTQTATKTDAERKTARKATAKRASAAASLLELDEAATRVLIDKQLNDMGWEANTQLLDYRKGCRPEAKRNMAIAEWPVTNAKGQPKRADYVLFIGLRAVAIIEAKRYGNDVADDLRQAEEYAAALILKDVPNHTAADVTPKYQTQWIGLNGAQFMVPFIYASNARPWLEQLQTKSGIWFRDLRNITHKSRALMNWHRPEELLAFLALDPHRADSELVKEPFEYLKLRNYQCEAIRHVEQALERDQRAILLAMATGTGKTRTIIGLIYRLLKAKRFERVLFLVDRNSLGTQAQDAFKEYRLDGNLLFSDIYDLKELEDKIPDSKTRVHVATVQAMVKRIFESDDPMPIRRYDCIIVDEAHRGYVLDRGMTEGEMDLRDEEDYVSSYRRVLDYFDATRIALTATPALHTTEIFGHPVYTYSYAEAVVDGYLVDHEPPISFMTELQQAGIHFDKGSEVESITLDGVVAKEELEDELHFEIDAFNRSVINESFSQVIVEKMVKDYLDPSEPEKTLVFCVNDLHADLVVGLFEKALDEFHGPQPAGIVQKITGAIRDPIGAIRQFRTQAYPKIVVTVDLLTTGVDVPSITNLLFMRRVRSRILYEQMKGRATRLCDDFPKDVFRIYDAVLLYKALAAVDTMLPTTRQPKMPLEDLVAELANERSFEHQAPTEKNPEATHADQVHVAIMSRLQRLLRRTEKAAQQPDVAEATAALNESLTAGGVPPLNELLAYLKKEGPRATQQMFACAPKLLEKLSGLATVVGLRDKLYISTAPDKITDVTTGYGRDAKGKPITKPQDYIEHFSSFIKTEINNIAALHAVATRPRSLTRADLKQLQLQLEQHGFGEKAIQRAWHDAKNVDIAATIIGYIRQAALGDALIPFSDRVDRATAKILASRAWSKNQENWLNYLANQVKTTVLIDDDLWRNPFFTEKLGPQAKNKLDKLFDGQFDHIIDQFSEQIWAVQA